MLEGFLSSTEPVIVTQTAELIQVSDQLALKSPWADDGALQPFSLGFLKGKSSGTHTYGIDVDLCGQQHRSQAGVLADFIFFASQEMHGFRRRHACLS